LVLSVLTLFLIVYASMSFNFKTAEAQTVDYTIEYVNHTVEVLYNGYVLINDTIRLNASSPEPGDFLIGFPYKYGPYVLRCIAYNENTNFPVSLNVPLENRIGFYGAEVSFPSETPQTFTVVFVLSNYLIIHDTTSQYKLDFPAYPSLTKPAAKCDASIVLPPEALYSSGTVSAFNYSKESLPAFTYDESEVTFTLADDKLLVVDVEELKREIRLNEFGEIEGADTYRIKNKAILDVVSIEVMLPLNASNVKAKDHFGRKMAQPLMTDNFTNRHEITFTLPLKIGESTRLTVEYFLPKTCITQETADRFALNISLFQNINYYIEQASVTFDLPEGAKILGFESALIGDAYSLARNIFEEIVTVDRRNVFCMDSFNVKIVYEYNPLWLSFRPTLWTWAISVVGCIIAAVWKRPKAPARVIVPTVAVSLRPEHIKSYVNTYEEKMRIVLEIESLETRVRKGKIPRRRYKVQRKTLETRLNTLSRNLTESKERMYAIGGHYADLMRQLEIAETEINEVEANIKSIEARHSRGELSLEAYRKLLADYQRRKERAETTISGLLLRLREEIR